MGARETSCALIADRSPTALEGVRGLLETRFEVVAVVADLASLLDAAARLEPDLVVVDISLARDTDPAWISRLRQRCPHSTLIALSVHDEPGVRVSAIRAGCDGFVLKRTIASELLSTIDRFLPRS